MAALRAEPPLDGSGRKIHQGHSTVGKNEQQQAEYQQTMQYHVQHPQQQTAIFQKAGWGSRLRVEREGIKDGGGV